MTSFKLSPLSHAARERLTHLKRGERTALVVSLETPFSSFYLRFGLLFIRSFSNRVSKRILPTKLIIFNPVLAEVRRSCTFHGLEERLLTAFH